MTETRDTVRDLSDIARAVRDRRRELRLRFEDVASMAGVSRHLVSAIENGQPSDQLEKLLRVLEALQIRVDLKRGVPKHVEPPAPRQRPARTRMEPAVDPREVDAGDGRTRCLDCGSAVRDIGRHVRLQHGLSIPAYRQRWGLDDGTGRMAADADAGDAS
jgi:transcriptional regulator with XRE-family HTH domain